MKVQEYAADLSLVLAIVAALATGAAAYLAGAGWEDIILRGTVAMAGVGVAGWLFVKVLSPAWFAQPRRPGSTTVPHEAVSDSDRVA